MKHKLPIIAIYKLRTNKKFSLSIICIAILLVCCTKQIGTNPALAYSDKALLDSAKNQKYSYYKNNPNQLLSGIHGPHGSFKLRFNSIAYSVLTDNGKLPIGSVFPEGSFIVKDVYTSGTISLYAYMYKHNGAWLWGEAKSNGEFVAKIKDGATLCVGCHSQSGNRDLAVAFNFY